MIKLGQLNGKNYAIDTDSISCLWSSKKPSGASYLPCFQYVWQQDQPEKYAKMAEKFAAQPKPTHQGVHLDSRECGWTIPSKTEGSMFTETFPAEPWKCGGAE